MTDPVTITVLGEPVPFARAGARGGVRFTPMKQRRYADGVKLIAQAEMAGRAPFDEALHVEFTADRSIPASWSKRRQALAAAGSIHPTSKPDLDNLYKEITDALNTIVFRDDALIVSVSKRKRYSAQPKITITVGPINGR